MILYRPMKPEDIPSGLSLCRSAGWNQLARDWELFLKLSPEGCSVAVDDDGNVIGTVATVRYEDHFSWIGMVLVDPARQRQGIGIQLLREALQILSSEETIKLDATPAGRQIYVQLDFVDEYSLSRMEIRKMFPATLPASAARPVLPGDLPAIFEIDREVFGANRQSMIEWLLKGSPQYAFLLEEQNRVLGYCFGRSGHNFTHIGPVISRDLNTAKHIVSAALQNCTGNSVILDALHHTPDWIQWLSSIGFLEQRPFIRMYRGNNSHPGIPENQFAILGPEFG